MGNWYRKFPFTYCKADGWQLKTCIFAGTTECSLQHYQYLTTSLEKKSRTKLPGLMLWACQCFAILWLTKFHQKVFVQNQWYWCCTVNTACLKQSLINEQWQYTTLVMLVLVMIYVWLLLMKFRIRDMIIILGSGTLTVRSCHSQPMCQRVAH